MKTMQRMGAVAVLAAALFGLAGGAVRADNWPQWMGPQRDGVWRETGLLSSFPPGGPKVRWRTPIGGGYSGPAVANGRVYVTDRILKAGAQDPENPFSRGNTPSTERILCLNEADGKVLWKHEYDCAYTISYPAGPRTTPTVNGGKVYSLGAEGRLVCLDVKTGAPAWSRELKKDYGVDSPIWGFSANLLVDGPRLICLVGGTGSAIVAFNKSTGKELWRALSATGSHGPGYSSPIIVTAGGTRQLIVWHPEAVASLEPATGKILWELPIRAQSGLALATPRHAGDRLFISSFYDGSMMLKLAADRPAADVVWRRKGQSELSTDSLHSIISTPFVEGDTVYGVCSHGQLRGLNASNGDRLWENYSATGANPNGRDRWATAFLVKNAARFFLFNEKGELIVAKLTPTGYTEISRAKVIEPTGVAQRRTVVWTHPAFANRSVYVRNDKEIVCVSLAK